jgi:hypothetical protein
LAETRGGKIRIVALSLFGVIICSLLCHSTVGRDDPLEVLWITTLGSENWYGLYIKKEPLVDVTLVPTGNIYYEVEYNREACRATRRYFPRNYGQLLEYEFILLNNWHFSCFTLSQLEWMRRAVAEEGRGGMIRSGVNWHREWAHLTVWDVFPDDVEAALAQQYSDIRGSFRMIVNEDPTLPPVIARYKDYLELEQ